MKKIFNTIIVTLFLSSCATSELARNYASNENYILLGIANAGALDSSVTNAAARYCNSKGKYAFAYEYDWISDGDGMKFYFWCKKNYQETRIVYNKTRKILWTNYKGTEVRSSKKSSSKKSARLTGASGSAFFVTNKGHIITNYHVIKGCNTHPKIKYKNKDVEAKVIARDTALDLALLKADLRNTKYVSLSNDQPKKLQRIIASGYPFGKYISDDLKFSSGIVSALKGPGDDTTLVQVDAALNPGNSGGPIVDEESGKLVAVSVMGMKKSISEGQNFGIKTSSVKNFLQTNKVKVPSSWFGASDVAKLLEDTTLYTFCR